MKTDVELCREIAAQVEDGTLPDAVMILSSIEAMTPDLEAHDATEEKPRLKVDLAGADSNIPRLVARAIHSLVRARRDFSALTLLPTIATPPENVADLLELLHIYLILDNGEAEC